MAEQAGKVLPSHMDVGTLMPSEPGSVAWSHLLQPQPQPTNPVPWASRSLGSRERGERELCAAHCDRGGQLTSLSCSASPVFLPILAKVCTLEWSTHR